MVVGVPISGNCGIMEALEARHHNPTKEHPNHHEHKRMDMVL